MPSPVLHQGECGGCYAHASMAALSAAIAIQSGKSAVNLSPQYVIDCARPEKGLYGCKGGDPRWLFWWLSENKGVPTLEDYPQGDATSTQSGVCDKSKAAASGTQLVKGYGRPNASETVMMQYVKEHGPIVAGIFADFNEFINYKDGVIRGSSCSNQEMNHNIVIVGYTTYQSLPVWIIRNSWGESWGMKGYGYIERGVNACYIGRAPTSITYS